MLENRMTFQWFSCCSLLLFFLCTKAQVPDLKDSHLVKHKNGIEVYTATGGHGGLKLIKVSAEMTGSLERVKQIFTDIASQPEWVYGTRKAYLVKKQDENNLLYYNETGLPWPASNRDVVIRMMLETEPGLKKLVVRQEAEPGSVPANKGLVRVEHLSGLWRFTETGNNKLKATYSIDIDPGGSLPAFVVNMFVAKGPYETFIKLQQLLYR
jgi:hypothetical protein